MKPHDPTESVARAAAAPGEDSATAGPASAGRSPVTFRGVGPDALTRVDGPAPGRTAGPHGRRPWSGSAQRPPGPDAD